MVWFPSKIFFINKYKSLFVAVIGKKGVIANAIRTIVQASSYINHERRVRINIDSF